MFTGLVEEIGRVKNITKDNKGAHIVIKAEKILEDVKLGDSISTNGVCLTVTSFSKDEFTAYAMPETMNKTNLSLLKSNDLVNLERALKLGDRLGGHMVSGHVDGVGKIVNIRDDSNARIFEIEVERTLTKYIVPKGSIGIDGISLTVVDTKENRFSVSIIPHTKEETTLYTRKIGHRVNIECDFLGKYVEKALNYTAKSNIDESFLKLNGFC
ncbi:riboflavin synthase [Anaeromicrobium sediminis]|uniref:Riboflavin synthase n=1 Tax=Anaeromicrobium sediminis TaxID=1478221 RepID=A0A267MK10_9FIRM|nr:riboflavin synthase [Anaeromicrobium sediminis]PAB59914.1 riboflavin synthase [Anaeromicrobium sediminis]